MYKVTSAKPRQIILESVKEYRDLITPTYGPAGQGVLIGQGNTAKLVDDGQMASDELEVKSELHNAVISYIKDAARKTNTRVGDGTTSSIILMSAIVTSLLEEQEFAISAKTSFSSEAKSLKLALKEAVAAIKKASKKIKTQEELYSIAYNSFNNEEIANLIADLVFKTGEQGVIAVEESQSVKTESELTQGLEIERGYASPYLSTGTDVKLKNPLIYLTTKPFDRFVDLATALETQLKEGKRDFVVLAESFADEVIAGVVVNNARGAFNIMLIQAPGYGDYKRQLLEDIAMLTGATVLDPKRGDEFALGVSEKVIITKDSTTFINPQSKAKLETYAKNLLKAETNSAFDKERLEKRAAALLGGIGIIRVGAHTESELKTTKAKVEDAVHATQAALRSGIVAGGGLTYASIKTSSEVLNNALKAPRLQLEQNGIEFLDKDAKDPTEVLIAALESAVSIASGLITTGSIIAEKREEKNALDFG